MEKKSAIFRGPYPITPECKTDSDFVVLIGKCRAVLQGGAHILQYRDKSATADVKRRRAQTLLSLCREHNAALIVNDDPQLAADINAHGAHLGAADTDIAEARAAFPHLILGATCGDSIPRIEAAQETGASYCALGAVFASQTKPGAPRCNLQTVTTAGQTSTLPVIAIGGITPQNAARVFAAGAHMAAACKGIFSDSDPKLAVQQIAAAQLQL